MLQDNALDAEAGEVERHRIYVNAGRAGGREGRISEDTLTAIPGWGLPSSAKGGPEVQAPVPSPLGQVLANADANLDAAGVPPRLHTAKPNVAPPSPAGVRADTSRSGGSGPPSSQAAGASLRRRRPRQPSRKARRATPRQCGGKIKNPKSNNFHSAAPTRDTTRRLGPFNRHHRALQTRSEVTEVQSFLRHQQWRSTFLTSRNILPCINNTDSLHPVKSTTSSSTTCRQRQGQAEELDFKDGSVGLITVGAAAQWFDMEKFMKEVDRVLKPKGCLGVYCYKVPCILNFDDRSEALAQIIQDIFIELKPYETMATKRVWHDYSVMCLMLSLSMTKRAEDIYITLKKPVLWFIWIFEVFSFIPNLPEGEDGRC
ncbi:uncharacterized protein LOC125453951 [Stegostoma tigrinum]|uniref:uncharacterized protein LOC125453951 n=1 Tax=Stegostoma tigrinum TaxID=3053191 RepID=UPI00286FB973|nr:uncharacterized protein LOC125453951 [Stegostoma tigrinum]